MGFISFCGRTGAAGSAAVMATTTRYSGDIPHLPESSAHQFACRGMRTWRLSRPGRREITKGTEWQSPRRALVNLSGDSVFVPRSPGASRQLDAVGQVEGLNREVRVFRIGRV